MGIGLTGADDVEPIHETSRPGDVRHSLADISKARADFGYSPVIGLREGKIVLDDAAANLTVDRLAPVWGGDD